MTALTTIAIMNALTTIAIMNVLILAGEPLNFTPKPDGSQEAWLLRVLRKRT